jgi:polysaccharide deacetylase family protein (PEP-CTERM system associated)
MKAQENIEHALTVDVEDAINQAMRNFFGQEMEPTFRVVDNTMRLLDLFAEFEAKATFFILGEVAQTHPGLIREIASRGHELGIHGYSHTRYTRLSRQEVKEEITRAKALVEDLSGMAVLGHRAPEFSINQENLWVLDILLEAGIMYDSSIFPAKSGRYGWKGFTKDIDWLVLEKGEKIIEAPMSTLRFMGKEIPACGGGYLRVFPYVFTRHAFKVIGQSRPVNLYLHPYEIDPPPFQPFYMEQISKTSLKSKARLRTYWFNRKTVLPKLRNLLGSYRFNSLRSIIDTQLESAFGLESET